MLVYPLLQPSRNIIGSRPINLGRFRKPERDSGSQVMRPSSSLEIVPRNSQLLASATEYAKRVVAKVRRLRLTTLSSPAAIADHFSNGGAEPSDRSSGIPPDAGEMATRDHCQRSPG